MHTNLSISSASDLENPGIARLSTLYPTSSFIMEILHSSELGTGKYFILLFTSDLVGNILLHSWPIFLKFCPKTERWSLSVSLAKNLTGNLSQVKRDLWKPAYLLHIRDAKFQIICLSDICVSACPHQSTSSWPHSKKCKISDNLWKTNSRDLSHRNWLQRHWWSWHKLQVRHNGTPGSVN